jgi:hypothetical protein
LSAKEQLKKSLSGVPFVAQYKYLGVILNKTLQPIAHLAHLQEKLTKFQRMSFILRAHRAPVHILQMLWKVFQVSSLSYAGFLSLPILSSETAFL